MTAQEALRVYHKKSTNSCVFMQQQESDWLREYGTPEGRTKWLEEYSWHHKTPKAAKSAWYRTKKQVTQRQRFNFTCVKGHESHCVRELIDGPDVFTMFEGPVSCDRQEVCTDFVSVDKLINHLLANPRASA